MMNKPPLADADMKLPESKFPRCLRCGKAVDTLSIYAAPNAPDHVIVEYECHGEHVSQEMPSEILANEQGLQSYTAFNSFTSGLMLHSEASDKAEGRKGDGK